MHQPHHISATTRIIALLGDPVAHSLSPALQNAAFAACGLDYAYVALRVQPRHLESALRGLVAMGFGGANLTVPHKQAALPFIDELRGDAALVGAVNTVVVEGEALVGHNTDAGGFASSLEELVPEGLAGRPALLLGAGGAARAVALALTRAGIGRLIIANRGRQRAQGLAGLVSGLAPGLECRVLGLDELTPADVRAAALVVNATTMGMAHAGPAAGRRDLGGQASENPPSAGKVPAVLVDNLGVDHIVYDVVYGSGATALVSGARAAGARAADGTGMLAWQAALAFQLWTGRPAPLDELKKAVSR